MADVKPPDNSPAWPPAPPEGKKDAPKAPAKTSAGVISLILSVMGVFGWIFVFAADQAISAPAGIVVHPLPLPGIYTTFFWWLGLGFGVAGRRTVAGKIGLGISLAALIIGAAILVWMVMQPAAAPVSAPVVPSLPTK